VAAHCVVARIAIQALYLSCRVLGTSCFLDKEFVIQGTVPKLYWNTFNTFNNCIKRDLLCLQNWSVYGWLTRGARDQHSCRPIGMNSILDSRAAAVPRMKCVRPSVHQSCMQQNPSWDADSFSAGQQTPHILQNRWFIYISMFGVACHMSPSWTRLIWFLPSHPISLISILILSSLLYLDLPSSLLLRCCN
jgi:hypothetical protein